MEVTQMVLVAGSGIGGGTELAGNFISICGQMD